MGIPLLDLRPKITKKVETPPPPPKSEQTVIARKAKEKADTARRDSTAATDKARKSQKTLSNATTTRNDAKKKVETATSAQANALSPAAKDAAQDRVDKATQDYNTADKAVRDAEGAASKDRLDAITAANKALVAQQEANDAAEKAKLPKPFPLAENQKDAFDAGSLSAKDQERLFGTRLLVSPKEAAESDAKRVSEATAKSPKAGAEELTRQLQQGLDPEYRKALMEKSAPDVDKMVQAAGDKATSAEDRKALMKNLADSADLAGPEGSKSIVDKLNAQPDQGSLVAGLAANGKDAKTTALGVSMAKAQRAAGNHDKADAIANATPELEKAAAESPLETALRKEVDLQTVGEDRKGVEDGAQQTRDNLKARTKALEELANHPEKLPPGVSVETKDGYGTTLVTKDEEGRVAERIRFGDTGNSPYISTTKFDHESGRVTSEEVTDDQKMGVLETHQVSWKDKNIEEASTLSNEAVTERIEEGTDFHRVSQEVSRDKDNRLVEKTRTQTPKDGVTETTRTFGTQKGEDGLNDALKGKFDDNQPLDKVDTKTVHIPPEGAKDPDGNEAKASITWGTSYSQGDVRATASESKLVDRPELRPARSHHHPGEKVSMRYASAEPTDTGDAESRAQDVDSSPKTWTLEKSGPNELNTQTFIEGRKDLGVTTRKKVTGNTVAELTLGTVPDVKSKDAKPVSVNGVAWRTYDPDGNLTKASKAQTGPDGTKTESNYSRTETKDAQGRRQVREVSTSSATMKDGLVVASRAESTKTYDDKNQVVAAHVDETDEKGTRMVRDYQRTEKRNAKGELEVHEKTEASVQEKDKPPTKQVQELVSVETKNGPELIKAANTLTTPDGTAQQVIDEKGQRLTVDGKEVKTLDELKALPKEKATLGAEAVDGLSQQVQNFTDLARQVKATQTFDGDHGRHDMKEAKVVVAANSAGLLRLKTSLTPAINGQPSLTLNPSARLAGGASGIVGMVGGASLLTKAGPQFMHDLRQENYWQAAKDGAAFAAGLGGLGSGASTLLTAARGAGGGLTLDGKLITAGGRYSPAEVASKLDKLGKVAMGAGVVSGGFQIYDGLQNGNGWQVASGATTATAAVGGYLLSGAAAGAWGGPAGAAVGVTVALAAWGLNKMFDHFDKSEYDIATPTI
ncbi:hypothetical protein MYSTI_05860 [Myxococcus stipitatus DSM 14675]|uniref:Uncharacterized protein n=1 Tax=Myxococcus stipitatus (strain DSM 14675 / JCM 12634 / Mx s8) TaxID=1278073 RepID=L7UDY9_MYXSD|nr:hypothetical protein [Myxococcus stipitatus]AGC47136.1 hypothetical protein MYSTI_05860 [Myxococcus stipitatus DSM 14675]